MPRRDRPAFASRPPRFVPPQTFANDDPPLAPEQNADAATSPRIREGVPDAAVLPGSKYVQGRTERKPSPRQIIAFDRRLWEVLGEERRLRYLSYAQPVRDCAKSLILRHGYKSWAVGGIANVRLVVEHEVVRFDQVKIIDFATSGFEDRPPDQEFLDCFVAATRRLRIACPGCKDGALEFDWRLSPWVYNAAGELWDSYVDPAIADSAFSVINAAATD